MTPDTPMTDAPVRCDLCGRPCDDAYCLYGEGEISPGSPRTILCLPCDGYEVAPTSLVDAFRQLAEAAGPEAIENLGKTCPECAELEVRCVCP